MAGTQFHPVTNNAVSRAASGSLNNTTNPVTFSVNTGEGALFPDPATAGPFWITKWGSSYPNPGADSSREVMLCTARSGDSLTCTRAQQGTPASAHAGSPFVGLLGQAGNFTEIHDAIHKLQAIAIVQNTASFEVLTQNTWTTRQLDTVSSDPFSLVSLSSNRFTLAAGQYRIDFWTTWSPATSIQCQSKLYNYTDSADVMLTYNLNGTTSGQVQGSTAYVSLAGSKAFEIRSYCTGISNQPSGGPPVTQVTIQRLG